MRATPYLVGAVMISLGAMGASWGQDMPPMDIKNPVAPKRGELGDAVLVSGRVVDMFAHLVGAGEASSKHEAGAAIGVRPESPVAGMPTTSVLLLLFDPDDPVSAVAFHSTAKLVGKDVKLSGRVLTADGVSAFQVMAIEPEKPVR